MKWYYHDEDTGMEYWHDGETSGERCHDGVGQVTSYHQSFADFMELHPDADLTDPTTMFNVHASTGETIHWGDSREDAEQWLAANGEPGDFVLESETPDVEP